MKPLLNIPGKIIHFVNVMFDECVTLQDALMLLFDFSEKTANEIYEKIETKIIKFTKANTFNDIIKDIDIQFVTNAYEMFINYCPSMHNILNYFEKSKNNLGKEFPCLEKFASCILNGDKDEIVKIIDDSLLDFNIEELADILKKFNTSELFKYIYDHRKIFDVKEIKELIDATNSSELLNGIRNVSQYLSDKKHNNEFIENLLDFYQKEEKGSNLVKSFIESTKELINKHVKYVLSNIKFIKQVVKAAKRATEHVYIKYYDEISFVTSFVVSIFEQLEAFVYNNTITFQSVFDLVLRITNICKATAIPYLSDTRELLSEYVNINQFDEVREKEKMLDLIEKDARSSLSGFLESFDKIIRYGRRFVFPFDISFINCTLKDPDSLLVFNSIRAFVAEVSSNEEFYSDGFPIKPIISFLKLQRSDGFDMRRFITAAVTHSEKRTEWILQKLSMLFDSNVPFIDVIVGKNKYSEKIRIVWKEVLRIYSDLVEMNISSSSNIRETVGKIILAFTGNDVSDKVNTFFNSLHELGDDATELSDLEILKLFFKNNQVDDLVGFIQEKFSVFCSCIHKLDDSISYIAKDNIGDILKSFCSFIKATFKQKSDVKEFIEFKKHMMLAAFLINSMLSNQSMFKYAPINTLSLSVSLNEMYLIINEIAVKTYKEVNMISKLSSANFESSLNGADVNMQKLIKSILNVDVDEVFSVFGTTQKDVNDMLRNIYLFVLRNKVVLFNSREDDLLHLLIRLKKIVDLTSYNQTIGEFLSKINGKNICVNEAAELFVQEIDETISSLENFSSFFSDAFAVFMKRTRDGIRILSRRLNVSDKKFSLTTIANALFIDDFINFTGIFLNRNCSAMNFNVLGSTLTDKVSGFFCDLSAFIGNVKNASINNIFIMKQEFEQYLFTYKFSKFAFGKKSFVLSIISEIIKLCVEAINKSLIDIIEEETSIEIASFTDKMKDLINHIKEENNVIPNDIVQFVV